MWLCLPLGLPVAIASPLNFDRSQADQAATFVALAPLFTIAYVAACAIERGAVGSRRQWLVATALGVVAMVPAAATLSWFIILGVAWLAVVGWVVPVVMNENVTIAGAFRRAVELFRADVVHALGGLATLVLIFLLTRSGMAWLLRAQADNTLRVSVFVADLVISPVIFLGAVIVYRDLAARVGRSPRDLQGQSPPE